MATEYKSNTAVTNIKNEVQRQMILVPFAPASMSPQQFEPAFQMAKETSAELVLLCVRPPEEAMWYAQEGEHLFSNLKGLYSQLQDCCPVPVKIETVVGPVAQFVIDYADRNDVDMIMLPDEPVSTGSRAVDRLLHGIG